MSKIFAKNWVQEKIRAFWKQCAGLVTDFVYKYKYDLFVRTKSNVILLELFFALVIFSAIAVILNHKYEGVPRTLASVMEKTFLLISTADLIITGLILIGITALFGYIIAYIALKPTRDALTSQKQFIGNVAHELRTPLSIIKTNIEVALLEDKLNPALRDTLLDNVDELDRTGDIINNLLSLNTLLNPEHVEFQNVNLGEVIDTALAKLSALAKQKNITITTTKGEFLLVWGNSAALEQVAMNLIKNALVYTPQNGHIDITVVPNYRGHIELCVRDSGVGIAREDLFHVFEPFYRADRSRARAHGGSGLGLTIVSELIKLHRGKITIQSTEKEGTAVLASLPCGKSDGALPKDSETTYNKVAIDFSHHKHPAHPNKD